MEVKTETSAAGQRDSIDLDADAVLSIDWEIANKQGIEPRSDREDEATESLDPVDYEIIKHRLFEIMDEARTTVTKLGADPVVHDAEEVGFFYYTAQGDVATAAAGIVWHAVGTPTTIKYARKHFLDNPTVGVYDEDYFFSNETLYGGTHPPDQLIFTPIFYEGELVAWCGALTHESETGAVEPGGMAPSATNRYSDGLLRVPPVKIVEQGRAREDIMTWMAMSVRDPRTVLLDERAKMAGLHRGKKRFLELCDKFGPEALIGTLRKSIEDSEAKMRAKLRSYPDGIYRATFFQDRGPVDDYAIYKIPFAVIKKGDRMVVELHGASPEQPNSYNLAGGAVKCFIFGPVCNYCYDVEWNGGLMAPIEVRPPTYNSIANPGRDAALSCGVLQGLACSEVVRKAFSLMQFDSPDRAEINAPWSVQHNGPVYGGLNQYGTPVAGATLEGVGMGTGAWSDDDGVDTGGESFSPVANTGDAEAWEDDVPLLNLDYRYKTDMVGYGKYQGGVSQVQVQMIWGVDELEWCSWGFGDRFHIAHSLYGGYSSPCYETVYISNPDLLERIAAGEAPPADWTDYVNGAVGGTIEPKAATNSVVTGKKGDIRVIHYGGGSGYGDPLDREPERVMDDIRNGIVSEWTAANIYFVAYDHETLELDREGTEKLRAAEREARLARGVGFDQFETGRAGTKPPEHLLRWYGDWSDAAYEEQLARSREIYAAMDGQAAENDDDAMPEEDELMPGGMRRQIGEYLGVDLESKTYFCWKCDHSLGTAEENFKKHTRIAERKPSEIYPPWPGMSGDADMCVVREFYCPGCGTMMENEYVPPGHPVMHDLEIDFDALRERVLRSLEDD